MTEALRLDGLDGVVPDILDTIANISNDEVFTPPRLANAVLDLLPPEVWSNPNLRFLDPFSKTGVFLREIAKRLMLGLEAEIPDPAARRAHIFGNQIFGCAITELTWLMSRRTLYGCKDASSDMAANLTARLPRPEGNIVLPRREHDFDKRGKCRICGIGADIMREGRESHAYALIHGGLGGEFQDMQFDVIVGNPPYQVNVGREMASFAVPIYQKFVEAAKALSPRYLAMIIPARWFTGGRGLEEFRSGMLRDRQIRALVDHPDSSECFSGVEIKGGICYFLRDAGHDGPCEVTTVTGDSRIRTTRRLDEHGDDMFIRHAGYLPIIGKVLGHGLPSFSGIVGPQTPFGLYSSWKGEPRPFEGSVLVRRNGEDHHIARADVPKGHDMIDRWKVLMPKAADGSAKAPIQVLGRPIVSGPGEACTQTYLVVGPFDTEAEADETAAYLRTKFCRFLVSALKSTQDGMSRVYQFVPQILGVCEADDAALAAHFGLSDDETALIDSYIR